MSSPHWTIATKLKTALTTWKATNWSDASVESGFQLEYFKELVTGDLEVIGIMPMSADSVDNQQPRREDCDLIGIGVLGLKRLADFAPDTVEPADTKMNALRDYLRSVSSIGLGGGLEAERESVKHFTIFDHDSLRSEFWASLILCEYTIDLPQSAEVTLS